MTSRIGEPAPTEPGFGDRPSEVDLAGGRLVIGGEDTPEKLYRRIFPDTTGGERFFVAWLIHQCGDMPGPGTAIDLPKSLDTVLDVGAEVFQSVREQALEALDGRGTFTQISELRAAAASVQKPAPRRVAGLAPPSGGGGALAGRARQRVGLPPRKAAPAASKPGAAATPTGLRAAASVRARARHISALVDSLAGAPDVKTRGERLRAALVDALVDQGIEVASGALLEVAAGGVAKQLNEVAQANAVRASMADAQTAFEIDLETGASNLLPEAARVAKLLDESLRDVGVDPSRFAPEQLASVAAEITTALRELAGRTGTRAVTLEDLLGASEAATARVGPGPGTVALETYLREHVDSYVALVGEHSTFWRAEGEKIIAHGDITLESIARVPTAELRADVRAMVLEHKSGVEPELAEEVADSLIDGLTRYAGGYLTHKIRRTAQARLGGHIAPYQEVLEGPGLSQLVSALAGADGAKIRAELGLPADLPGEEGPVRAFLEARLDAMRDAHGKVERITTGEEVFEVAPWATRVVANELGLRLNTSGDVTVDGAAETILETGIRKHKATQMMLTRAFKAVAAIATAPISAAFEVQSRSLSFLIEAGASASPVLLEIGALELATR